MTVQSIDALSAAKGTDLYAMKRNDAIGKMDFLKLLIAQLQQQDPLNPQDPAEFTAQLTQFSSLEQMMSISAAIEGLQILQLSANNTLASSLIGKDVLYEGGKIQIDSASASSDLYFQAPSAAKDLTITITDSAGKAVRNISVDSAQSGINKVAWDGLDNSGNPLLPGTYTMKVSGQGGSGDSLVFTPMQKSRVIGISFVNGVTNLDIGGSSIPISEVVSVYEASAIAA